MAVPVEIAILQKELADIERMTRQMRIKQCAKNFLVWRNAGFSPYAVMLKYRLNTDDMYHKVLSEVEKESGISRMKLLKYPKCGSGSHAAPTEYKTIKPELSEAERLIELFQKLSREADNCLGIIREVLEEE